MLDREPSQVPDSPVSAEREWQQLLVGWLVMMLLSERVARTRGTLVYRRPPWQPARADGGAARVLLGRVSGKEQPDQGGVGPGHHHPGHPR